MIGTTADAMMMKMRRTKPELSGAGTVVGAVAVGVVEDVTLMVCALLQHSTADRKTKI
jgi:hypothetical protein